MEQGSNRQTHLFRSTGVMGTACWKGESGNWGRPVMDGGCGLDGASRRQSTRESDRVVRPLRPGNAGGGKDPDFWYAFDEEEDW